MKIGIFIGSIGSAGSVTAQVQQVVDAEKSGFDSFWAAHIMDADIMTMFSLAGQMTNKIEMGTAVTPTYLRHPIAMAQQAITTLSATQGRFTLGMGVSHKPVVEERFGMRFHRPAKHMEEYLEIIKSLNRDGRVNYQGEVLRANTQFTLNEKRGLPIVIAALGPRMLRTAGQIADGTVTWMTGKETLKSHIVPKIKEAAQSVGKSDPRVIAALPVAVSTDHDKAFQTAATHFERYGELPSYKAMLEIEGVESPAEMAIIGDEAEVEEEIRAYASAGATEIAAQIFPVGTDRDSSINRTRRLLASLVGRI